MRTFNEGVDWRREDDPIFALRIVAVDDGGETRFLSTDMRETDDGNASTWEHADSPVQVHASWQGSRYEIRLCNHGPRRLAVDFYGPLLTRLSERDAVAHVPQVGGVVFPVQGSNYLHHNSGQLASLFMILQMGERGVALGHEKTAEDEGRYRSGIAVHGQGLAIGAHSAKISDQVGSAIESGMGKLVAGAPAADLGGVACFVENVMLEPESEQVVGPYLVLPYEGAWTQGAALLREKRYPRPMKPRPAWFKPVHNCAEICWGQATKDFTNMATIREEQRQWGSPLFSLNYYFETHSKMTWGSSFKNSGGAAEFGGDEALFKAIDEVHRQGSKVLFYVTPWSLTCGYDQTQVCIDRNWYLQEHPGADASPLLDYGEFGKFACPCPMHEPARQWVVEGIAETLKKYPIDGFFFDEAAAIVNRPCYNPEHNHRQPYIWTYGNYLVFRDLRRAMDKINPDAIILSEGGSELYREFIDGCLGHTNGWSLGRHGAPVTRAVVPGVAIFDSVTGIPASMAAEAAVKEKRFIMETEQMLGIQFAGGIPYYVNGAGAGRLANIWPEHERYRRAYPEMFSGDIEAAVPAFEPGSVVGYLIRSGDTRVLTVANPQGWGWGNGHAITVTLPVPAKTLYDRVEYRYYDVRDGQAELRLKPYGVMALEVIA